MSQQTPPNTPDDNGRDEYGAEPSFAQNPGMEQNPYYQGSQAGAQPDLDSGSPVLTSVEAQRLNRKALLFLGGIVVLLLLLAYFVLGREKEIEETPQSNKDKVAIPTAPTVATADEPPVPPVELMPMEPPPGLPPPLPEESNRSSGNGQYGGGEPMGPQPLTLQQRRMMAAGGSATQMEGSQGGSAGAGASDSEFIASQQKRLQDLNAMAGLQPGGVPAATAALAATSAQFMSNPNALLVRGTYLRCVLETRIITDIPGYTSCIVTEPVYSVNGKQLLLPKGSKLLGQYGNQEDGIARVAVVWDRAITPTGIDVRMSSPGVDGLGGAGHPGDYNAHWGSKITSALLISLIADGFSYAAAKNGPETTVIGAGGVVTQQPFESATARSMERLANQALQKSANRPGTVTINQGAVVNIYVAQDVDFTGVLAVR